MTARLATAFCLIVMLASSGCSLRLTYNFLDWWIGWQVEDYVDLNGEQKSQLSDAAKTFHRWHRQQELTRYAQLCEDAALLLQQPQLTVAQLAELRQRTEQLWQAVAEQLIAPGLALIPTLSDQQLVQIHSKLTQELTEELRQRAELSPAQIQQQRTKRVVSALQKALGKLNREQLQLIDQQLENFISAFDLAAEQNQREITRFMAMLQRRQEAPFLAQELRDILMNTAASWSDEYRRAREHNRQATLALVVALRPTLSAKQQRKLQEFFSDYRDTFTKLAEL